MLNVAPLSSAGVIEPSRTRAASARVVGGDLGHGLDVGVEHGGHDERVGRGHRDPDVDAAVGLELAVAVGAADPRELAQRERRPP